MDCAVAHRIVCDQFPEFAGVRPEYLGRGWDNFCVEYPNDIVFRLPTRKLGADILRHEIAALPIIASAISTPQVPEIRYVGESQGGYPYAFIGYPKISGQTADQIEWSHQDRLRAARVLGSFLRALHRVDPEQTALEDLPVDDPAKRDPSRILEKLRTRLALIESRKGPLSDTMLEALTAAELAAEQQLHPCESCLIHGDLYPRHVVGQSGEIKGVIDWGDVQIGDPSIDLSIAYTFFQPEERPAFWAAHGRPESDFNRPVMIARSAMYGFALIAYGLEEADHASVAMGELILSRLR